MALTDQQIEQLRKIEIPWGEIGYITYKRTYARRLKEDKIDSPTEEYIDTVLRVVKASQKQLKVNFTNEEEYKLAEILLKLKGSVAGRFLWQLGTKTVDNLGLPSLQNCAVCVVNEPIRPFTWAMEMLMLGCGVGYNIQKEYVYQIPSLRKEKLTISRIDDKNVDFIVPDTREGWVKLLGKVLKAHFYTGKGFTYSCQLVRSEGELIKSFGGTASGPSILEKGIDQINNLLNDRAGKKLRPIDCLDIMNIIASIIVAGNVRRSAQLAIGDWDDLEFLKAKRWDLGSVPNWRSNSNNSIVPPINLKDLPAEFWQTYDQGEPYGLINLELSRNCGRLGETQYKDSNIVGYNPCVSGDTEILTDIGYVRIDTVINTKVNVWTGYEFSTVTPKITGYDQPMLNIILSTGQTLKCTYYHNFILSTGERIRAIDLKLNDELVKFEYPELFEIDKFSNKNVNELSKIIGIEQISNEDIVYCFDEPIRHSGCFNGIITGQCAEQSLENFETCCLAEIFLPNIESESELFEVAEFLYRINKHSLALPCSIPETEDIVHKNMRMGIGVTGLLQSTEEQKSWLANCYDFLRKYDAEYSKEHNWPISIKLTTTKPSGCVSIFTKIKTDHGVLDMNEIFKLNNINLQTLADDSNIWFENKTSLHVKDMNDNLQPISKLFINGLSETIKLFFDDSTFIECTPCHKFLTKHHGWITANDLNSDHEIVYYN